MGKSLFIAEKPSVAKEFAKALKYNMKNRDGYMESEEAVVTWCVGHLVTMSYPEVYDEKYKRWSLETIPFIPQEFKYEVIDSVKKQFGIVSGLLNRKDVETIYVCTDSGREGEYIYRLVEQQAGVSGKVRRRVWIDSQTEEEILRGIREAKDLSAYDNLSHAAYLRAKEDYLMGINFSRALTLKYSYSIKNYLNADKAVVSVGRVMTCVLGMVVNREREIREFVKIPFYRILMKADIAGHECSLEWKAVEGSRFYQSPKIYKDNGFLEEKDADAFLAFLQEQPEATPLVEKIERKKETKNPPLLYNLAELQNDCSKLFKISPDETLRIAQELYEKKLTTYPRTDARVLSTAVAKEIGKNIKGLLNYQPVAAVAEKILREERFQGIVKTRYVNDKQITDHYAVIPTGQGLSALNGLHPTSAKVYEIIVRRFLSIFYPAAVYQKITLTAKCKEETFLSSFKVQAEQGYLEVSQNSFARKRAEEYTGRETVDEEQETSCDISFMEALGALKKGAPLDKKTLEKKEGETSPPKRYNSGTMILTMENAGQFIEDEELRAQIKGSGIGTSATRAEILKKLVHIKYLDLNKKTQIITPTLLGEMIYEVVAGSVKPLLDPRLTASWEKGLTLVASGEITEEEYMVKLNDFVTRRTNFVKQMANQGALYHRFQYASQFYKEAKKEKG
ncbi:MAG: type IA DNA topoisomerase [Lachnospiraceae bacterium]|jgi:DNA topoisomerase-3|nr:type IA DNA topoisomerase [Lachnospiraceae bacterium]